MPISEAGHRGEEGEGTVLNPEGVVAAATVAVGKGTLFCARRPRILSLTIDLTLKGSDK